MTEAKSKTPSEHFRDMGAALRRGDRVAADEAARMGRKALAAMPSVLASVPPEELLRIAEEAAEGPEICGCPSVPADMRGSIRSR